jgi:hypothetical protein
MKKLMKRVGPLGLSLAAAALTAVAFAAISVAQDGSGGERNDSQAKAERPGPPMMHELSDEDREALEGFRSCMEENGAPPPPEPPAPGEGREDGPGVFEHRLEPPSDEERAQIEKALEACKDRLPEGAPAFGPGPGGPPCGPPPGVRPEDGGRGSDG